MMRQEGSAYAIVRAIFGFEGKGCSNTSVLELLRSSVEVSQVKELNKRLAPMKPVTIVSQRNEMNIASDRLLFDEL